MYEATVARVKPDVVIFGKKAQGSGVFVNPQTITLNDWQLVEMFNASPVNILLFDVPYSIIP